MTNRTRPAELDDLDRQFSDQGHYEEWEVDLMLTVHPGRRLAPHPAPALVPIKVLRWMAIGAVTWILAILAYDALRKVWR